MFLKCIFWFSFTRSSTTPSRTFTTSPKLSSNSSASISSAVINGNSTCGAGYSQLRSAADTISGEFSNFGIKLCYALVVCQGSRLQIFSMSGSYQNSFSFCVCCQATDGGWTKPITQVQAPLHRPGPPLHCPIQVRILSFFICLFELLLRCNFFC